jgi:hypothetical protein
MAGPRASKRRRCFPSKWLRSHSEAKDHHRRSGGSVKQATWRVIRVKSGGHERTIARGLADENKAADVALHLYKQQEHVEGGDVTVPMLHAAKSQPSLLVPSMVMHW